MDKKRKPNKKTIEAIEEGRRMIVDKEKGYKDIDELKEALGTK